MLVKKTDGTFPFCVDYRKLNGVTKRDAHPLPRVDDLLDVLHGTCIFSTLDLHSGYWQVSEDPWDREKTAFVTPEGLWEFLRLPFGVGLVQPFSEPSRLFYPGLIIAHACPIFMRVATGRGATRKQIVCLER